MGEAMSSPAGGEGVDTPAPPSAPGDATQPVLAPVRRSFRRGGRRNSRAQHAFAVVVIGYVVVSVVAGLGGRSSARPVPPPSAEVAGLAAHSMSKEGRKLFYAAAPTILERSELTAACPFSEPALVLGCYSRGRIYILRVTRPELARVMEVTAAHEMLHAAYAQLSASERKKVDGWVGDFYAGMTDPGIRDLVARYDKAEPRERLNELHSILPTQVGTLNPVLERHFRRYLVSRDEVVAAFDSYEGVFTELKRHLADLHADIADRKAQLRAMSLRSDAEKATLDDLDRRLDALKAQGSIRAYNDLIPQQNAQVDLVRSLIDEYNRLVDAHNEKVKEANALALQQDELVEGLSGRASPVAPTPRA